MKCFHEMKESTWRKYSHEKKKIRSLLEARLEGEAYNNIILTIFFILAIILYIVSIIWRAILKSQFYKITYVLERFLVIIFNFSILYSAENWLATLILFIERSQRQKEWLILSKKLISNHYKWYISFIKSLHSIFNSVLAPFFVV